MCFIFSGTYVAVNFVFISFDFDVVVDGSFGCYFFFIDFLDRKTFASYVFHSQLFFLPLLLAQYTKMEVNIFPKWIFFGIYLIIFESFYKILLLHHHHGPCGICVFSIYITDYRIKNVLYVRLQSLNPSGFRSLMAIDGKYEISGRYKSGAIWLFAYIFWNFCISSHQVTWKAIFFVQPMTRLKRFF